MNRTTKPVGVLITVEFTLDLIKKERVETYQASRGGGEIGSKRVGGPGPGTATN